MGSMFEISCRKVIVGIASLRECDKAIYSLSVVDRLISVCNFDNQIIGHPAYNNTEPICDNTDEGLLLHDLFQSPAKEASTKTSILFDLSIVNKSPAY